MTRRMTAEPDSIDLAWVIGLSVAQLISWGSVFYGFSLFMAPVEGALHVSRGESSFAFSLALLMEGLCAFHVGRWIDRGHERAVMTTGSALLAVGFVAQAFIHQLWQFYLVWALLGVGLSATLYTPAFAVLTRRFPGHFRRAIILLTFLGGLASTVFIPLIAGLMHATDWQTTSWCLGLLQLLVCVPLHFRLLRNAPPGRVEHAPEQAKTNLSIRAQVNNPTFGLIAVFMVLLMAVTAALPAHMINLLREAGLQEAWVLALPAIIGVLQVVGRAGLFVTEHRLDVHRVNRWVPCLIPLSFAMLCVGGTHGGLAVCFVVAYGLGNGMFTIVKGTLVAQYVSQTHVGSLNGVVGLPMALARAAAPWLMGVMWQPDVGYQYGLQAMLALSCLGVAALWLAQRRALGERRRAAHPN